MNGSTHPNPDDALTQAEATIARQAAEIERLTKQIRHEDFAEDLGKVLLFAATAGSIASPVTHSELLSMIVETAAHIISAEAASLLLIDRPNQQLVFEVAIGSFSEEVKKIRVPLGEGIAGLVAVSGQPMAIRNRAGAVSSSQEIADRIGYLPGSVLCVPLFYHDTVIGVLELLDKAGEDGFSPSDMAALGLFANLAAVAIEHSKAHRHLTSLVMTLLKSLREAPEEQTESLERRIKEFAETIEADPTYAQALEMASLVHEITWRGEREALACRTLLRGFGDYLRQRPGAW